MSGRAAKAWVLHRPPVTDPHLPTVVMLHGVGADHSVWQPQSAFLSRRGFNVLVPDLPGHGRTPGPAARSVEELARWTVDLLARQGIVRVHFAGHSLGSLVALETAAAHPSLVESLALLSSADRLRVHPELLGMARGGDGTVIDLMSAWSFPALHAGASALPGMSPQGAVRRLLRGTDMKTIAAGLGACDAYDAAARTAAVTCPALLISGEADRMAPRRSALALADALPVAGMRLLPGTGHCPMLERPGEVARMLWRWFGAGEP